MSELIQDDVMEEARKNAAIEQIEKKLEANYRHQKWKNQYHKYLNRTTGYAGIQMYYHQLSLQAYVSTQSQLSRLRSPQSS